MKIQAILAVALVLACLVPHAAGETGGVQVENIPPTFADISMDEDGRLNAISINISDYNSYQDLRWVYVNISDGQMLISSMAYMCGEDVNQTGNISNVVGKHLIHQSSSVTHSDKTIGLESCFLILDLRFRPVNGGDTVEITASDMTGETVTYAESYVYPILSDEASAFILTVVLIVSLTISVVIQVLRRRNVHETL